MSGVYGQQRTLRRSLALSRTEKRMITRYAKLHGLSFSAYVRMRATSDPIERVS